MREFKFRAWHNNLLCMENDVHMLDRFADIIASPEKFALMQYTGLKDKNGKEIYEGDVVRFLNGETTSTESGMECDEFLTDGAVFWDDEYAQWDITHRIDVSREDIFTDISEYEICGNIYENPNLLK